MNRRVFALLAAATVALAGVFAFAVASRRRAGPPPDAVVVVGPVPAASGELPVLFRVPAFTFPNQREQATSAADLRGRVWIANFVFTQCTTACPLITAKMALLQRRLARPDVRFVSFSVDPKHDDAKALARYAGEWRPGETRWLLLSTTPSGLANLAAGMFVEVRPAENDIVHTKQFFLVDGEGSVRGIYESEKDDALERLARDAEALAGAPSPAPARPSAANGAELYRALGCETCHARSELAPPLGGLLGRRVGLEGGGEVVADAEYVRESIVSPNAKVTAGFLKLMPSYQGELTTSELDALVDHVGRLPAAPASPSAAAPARAPAPLPSSPPAAPASVAAAPGPEAPSALAVDPVCKMDVRVTGTTPRATHAGHAYYFCSEMCRSRFAADPARFAKPAR